ncbi:MAG TPA: hypothetical protein VHY30_10150 [Verrucomicrobiae bacterium]|jgi:hypothetical protein|nr:hypothetical protein [Verrucomicrobiae bacterium]
MAKKASGRAGSPLPADGAHGVTRPTKLKSSALLDTRVVYCGDNLESPGRMQKEECRMMKPAHFPILHSSFILLNSPLPASNYVKVLLDQIFGGNNFQNSLAPMNQTC